MPLSGQSEAFDANGRKVIADNGVLRAIELVSDAQSQTRETFGFKWQKRDTFEGGVARYRRWLLEKYGDIPGAAWFGEYGPTQFCSMPAAARRCRPSNCSALL